MCLLENDFCGHDHKKLLLIVILSVEVGDGPRCKRRQDGSGYFDRTQLEYEDGFSSLTDEFWYGLIGTTIFSLVKIVGK